MNAMNEFVKPTLVLAIICLVITALLSVSHEITQPIIQENERKTAELARAEVLAEADSFEQLTGEFPEGVQEVYAAANGVGYTVTITSKGYASDPLKVMVGIKEDGTIEKVKVLANNETPGLGSNIVISLLKKVIPDKVRIPCYIVVIAGFVTLLSALLQAYATDIYNALGIFLPLIVVNCIILGRAEMFASKNSVLKSALDGIGMGIGFTLALLIIGSIREILGSGTWFGLPVTINLFDPISIFVLAPGGFLVFGCVIALLNKLTNGKGVKRKSFDCASCPNASGCSNAGKGGCE